MIISEKDFLKKCKSEGLQAFKVTTELDEVDIILDTEDLNQFWNVCRCYGTKCIFYSYFFQTPENYILSKEVLLNHVEEFIRSSDLRQKYNPWGFNDDAFNPVDLINKYNNRIDQLICKQQVSLKNISWGEPIYLEAFMTSNGDRIGIRITSNDISKKTEWEELGEKLIAELDAEIENEVATLYHEYSESQAEAREKERAATESRYNTAITEIKSFLTESDKLMTCTNGKLRHAYARDLADEYSQKHDCYITIGEIDVLVDTEYKRRKNKK